MLTVWTVRDPWMSWNTFARCAESYLRHPYYSQRWRFWIVIDGKRRPVEFLHFRFEQLALPIAEWELMPAGAMCDALLTEARQRIAAREVQR